jgi:hypothetical protein
MMTGSPHCLRANAVVLMTLMTCVPGLSDASAQTAGVQSPAAQKPPEAVVVTGQRQNDTIDTVVSQFIDVHAKPNRKTGQYMRDDAGPVCPETFGMPQAFNAFVNARVLAVAASVGARTVSTGCKPNVEILFTDQPAALVKSIAERTRGAILGMHYVHETPRLLEVTHPIQAWYVSGTRYDDVPIAPVASVDMSGDTHSTGTQTAIPDSAYRRGPEAITLGSRIPARRVSSIVNVLIVADINKLAGHEIGPVSDYIAMLALSQPRSLDECNALPSILDLMANCDGRQKTETLTAGDMAYLKGLYAADLGAITVSRQKDSIASGMKTNLDDH